jgi:hypothetical protein
MHCCGGIAHLYCVERCISSRASKFYSHVFVLFDGVSISSFNLLFVSFYRMHCCVGIAHLYCVERCISPRASKSIVFLFLFCLKMHRFFFMYLLFRFIACIAVVAFYITMAWNDAFHHAQVRFDLCVCV